MWLIAAVVVQFIVIAVLALVVLSLARQVGILHERTAPAGLSTKAADSIPIGGSLAAIQLSTLSDDGLLLAPGARRETTTLLFVSADCPICRSVLPAYQQALTADSQLSGWWVGDGSDAQRFADYTHAQAIAPERALLSQDLGLQLGIRELPALVALDADNRLLLREVLTGPRGLETALAQLARPQGENSA